MYPSTGYRLPALRAPPTTRPALREATPGKARHAALLGALDAVPTPTLGASIAEVARRLPVLASVEVVAIRLRESDGDSLFHLVAMEGASPRERRARALNPLSFAAVKTLATLGLEHTLAKALGLRWQGVEWIRCDGGAVGVLVAGCRTDRQPTERGRLLLVEMCNRLGERLAGVDRSRSALMEVSQAIAREAAIVPEQSEGALAVLRPRERNILSLYAEGLAVEDIARLLVISPHTVRTHVKNAFRGLRVHSREEAARLVFADEVHRLL